jgi:hypothetical protein
MNRMDGDKEDENNEINIIPHLNRCADLCNLNLWDGESREKD